MDRLGRPRRGVEGCKDVVTEGWSFSDMGHLAQTALTTRACTESSVRVGAARAASTPRKAPR